MVSFQCDYTTGAHPAILQRFAETNMIPQPGYGDDEFTLSAKEKIRAACGCPEAEVELLVGGTQTNAVVISTMLHDYEGVVTADTGHINVHEAGAIEFGGHKVLALPGKDAKLAAPVLQEFLEAFYENPSRDHMVFPGMVYITFPTELGTLYTLEELTALSAICRQYQIPLYMDGARLGYGLASRQTDVTLQDIVRLTDVFYIGGTKVGALCGEAIVFTHGNRPPHFLTQIKRRGALLAKGRVLGLQFDTLFTDDLYMKISRHAIDMAERLKEIIRDKGWEFYRESPTNQQFILIPDEEMEALGKTVQFEPWERYDKDRYIIRLATSWCTTQEDLDTLAAFTR
ncbi:MAG: low specificity L-threonine aldolase [Lachnospiraceae bacterium]|nr:low specificity L-threonine aldolase [Lachnospiraceae bacterium]